MESNPREYSRIPEACLDAFLAHVHGGAFDRSTRPVNPETMC